MEQRPSRHVIPILEGPRYRTFRLTRDHPIFFFDPDSLRLSLLASDSALFFAASSGFALALFSLALIFFADAFSELDKGASFILVWSGVYHCFIEKMGMARPRRVSH